MYALCSIPSYDFMHSVCLLNHWSSFKICWDSFDIISNASVTSIYMLPLWFSICLRSQILGYSCFLSFPTSYSFNFSLPCSSLLPSRRYVQNFQLLSVKSGLVNYFVQLPRGLSTLYTANSSLSFMFYC